METKEIDFKQLHAEILGVIDSNSGRNEKMQRICNILKERTPYYDWVGFYLTDPEREAELFLGPFAGEPTQHTRIRFGEGICGQAADREETFVVQDVSKETNYLSCSPFVRSEIVIPIIRDGDVLGELDIDSHALAPFTDWDRKFLEQVCEDMAKVL